MVPRPNHYSHLRHRPPQLDDIGLRLRFYSRRGGRQCSNRTCFSV
jgi:hypothetical protein